jgi:hypothetical protein
MYTKINPRLQRVLIMLLVAVVLIITVSRMFFYHSHIDSEGQIISHSHPYNTTSDSTPFKTHHHSLYDFYFIQSLENIFTNQFIYIIFFFSILIEKYLIYNTLKNFDLKYSRIRGRSPPFISF